MDLMEVNSPEALMENVRRAGFLPFFQCPVPGLSVEEHTPSRLWFSDTEDGPWEWKGPVARSGMCVYGKFFGGKAGFVSLDWLPDLLNYRRDGYDYDARWEDGLAPAKDWALYQVLDRAGSMQTGELKKAANYRKDGNKGFETVITRLQHQLYVVIADFEYRVDKQGKRYGWGVARYATPESLLGREFVDRCYQCAPTVSKERLIARLRERFPQAEETALLKLLG